MSLFKLSGAPNRPKRLLIQPSATSPFCTSPSQLQEVTLDPDVTNFSYMGMRSPGALTSGRSVKEIDEQLTNLRKENFNLKLRIYFLEERMGANFNTDKEDAIKKNIELMVELENVRKELEDKQELLCQAAKAMEIEEEEKKKELAAKDHEISRLKEMLEEIECQLQTERLANKQMALCTEAFDLNVEDHHNLKIIEKLQNTIKNLQTELKREKEHADQFENIIKVAERTQTKCETLITEVQEKDNKLYDLSAKLEETDGNISKCNIRITMLEEELKEKTTELDNARSKCIENEQELTEHRTQIKEIKKQHETMQQHKNKFEKKAEKYKLLLTHSENKLTEMVAHADVLNNKIQNLEVRLAAALHEVKRTNSKTENISSAEQRHKPNNTDVALFSVRNESAVPETTPPSKTTTSQIIRPNKSIQSGSPSTSPSPLKSQNDKHSSEINEISPIVKNVSSTEFAATEIQLSPEEVLELKRNHYKACKIIKTMIQKKKEYLEQIDKLQTSVSEKGSEIQCLRGKIVELSENNAKIPVGHKRKSIQEKISELNLTACSNPSANKENSMAGDEMHLAEQYKELANELERKIEVLNATLNEKDTQLEQFKIEIQTKVDRIIDLEFELLTLNQGVDFNFSGEKEDVAEKLTQETVEKEQKIQQLESELRKRTCDLQGIVNKELWEKNRLIGKLQTSLKSKNEEIGNLEKSICGKELQLNILKDKINELGVHVNLPPGLIVSDTQSQINTSDDGKVCLEERKHFMQEIEALRTKLTNIPEHDENNQLSQLKLDNNDLREELEKCEKLRQENQEICSVLSTRLEELCHFLNSLLKHKSVLGFLSSDQTHKLQQVIDKSLDLSRTLSTTISLNPDQSLLQLSNISNLLSSSRNDSLILSDYLDQEEENNSILSIIPSNVTLTYHSHLNRNLGSNADQVQVIKVLRQQVANLKHEIEVRDVELGKKLLIESVETEKLLGNDEQFIDAVADLQQQTDTPGKISQNLVSDSSKLNVTSSTLVAEKSAVSNTTSTTLKNQNFDNHSESESWSEPDRTVSMARIGLHDESLKKPCNVSLSRRSRFASDTNLSTESTEDDQALSSARTPPKKTTLAEGRQTILALHEQVCELEVQVKEKENELLTSQVAFYKTDNLLKQEQTKLEELKKENSELSLQIIESNKKLEEAEKHKNDMEIEVNQITTKHSQLILQIKEANSKLEQAEQVKQESEGKIAELQNIVAVLEEFRKNIETQMISKDKQMQNTINEMEVEKAKAVEAACNAEKILEKAKKDMQIAERELKNMHERELKIRAELEVTYNENLKKAEEQFLNSVKTLKCDYEMQISKYQEMINQVKEIYDKDYIKKTEVQRRVLEVEQLTKELENLKSVIQDNSIKMCAMDEKETELKNQVMNMQQDHCDKINELRTELDNATLHYSETILEKTKLRNENTALEQQVQKLCTKETELIKEVNNIHKELLENKTSYEVRVSKLEHQKTSLELKINDLENVNTKMESINTELHNYLMEFSGKGEAEHVSGASVVNNPVNLLNFYGSRTLPLTIQSLSSYSRQLSDQSGYTSEDVPHEELVMKNMLYTNVHNLLESNDAEHERLHANSSPDLGIESDHGRFSSLEANINIPRPLLPSLELAQSMNNLLDPIQDMICSNKDCCKKSKQICSENVDLRKRLLRTRRALEDTLTRLTLANKQKKEIEKSICRQIHKTSQVLRKAKANLDSGSETDILKK